MPFTQMPGRRSPRRLRRRRIIALTIGAASVSASMVMANQPGLGSTASAAPATASAAAAVDPACPWTDTTKTPAERANLLLDASTLDQQIRWLNEVSANDPTQTSIPTSQGLGQPPGPPVTYAASVPCVKFNADIDGPWGIAYGTGTTAFPVPVSQAASWDLNLTDKKAAVMADEAWKQQYNTLFAPALDIVRTPLGGRNPEYLGEDPLLSGDIGTAWINALRDSNPGQPVGAVIKHFLGNNQELDRGSSSSNIDERTLHELYLKPYEIALRANPAGVMCGFNQVNDVYSCESKTLLTDILRKQLGFQGYVITDNGSQRSTAGALNAGVDIELSNPKWYTPGKIKQALADGKVTAAQIRQAAFRVLQAKFANGAQDHDLPTSGRYTDVRQPVARDVALEMAQKGSVLLKNQDNTLPITRPNQTIAVIGPTASNDVTPDPAYDGGGVSARSVCTSPLFGLTIAFAVIDCHQDAPLDAIRARAQLDGDTVVYDNGSDPARAAQVAAAADTVVVFGFNRSGESFDLPDMNLFEGGNQLIQAVSSANPNTTVVLETGGPVLMPWISKTPAVLEAWYPGDRGGEAIAGLLFGDVNPSGKLPVTFPRTLADLPTGAGDSAQYPGVFSNGSTVRPAGSDEIRQVNYSEGLQVGYRWYQQQNIRPLFAFGHGLSYTDFAYSDLQVTSVPGATPGSVRSTVQFTVTNTGARAGAEVPQVYLGFPDAAKEPGSRLVAFDRIYLEAGESRVVTEVVDSDAPSHPFSVWDTDRDQWRTVDGTYRFRVGDSSLDQPLLADVQLPVTAPVTTNPGTGTGAGTAQATAQVKVKRLGRAAQVHHRVRVRITVASAVGVPTGQVTIRVPGRHAKTVTLVDGSATVAIGRFARPGHKRIRVFYSGDPAVAPLGTTQVIRVHRR